MNHDYARTHRRTVPRPLVPARLERTRGVAIVAIAAALVAGAACDSPERYLPFDEFGGPTGVLDGTVTYSGPLPCTEEGRIVGAAVLLAFDVRLLPPPEGLGTTAASIAVVPGEVLFAGVRDELTFDPGGYRWCPKHRYLIGAQPDTSVTVSAPWAIAPLVGGTYQVRGFYDIDGDFDPGFLISNLPTKGDIVGAAVENPSGVLRGQAPRYRELTLGDLQPDGTRAIGEQGDRVQGISVALGLELGLERPIFFPGEVLDEFEGNKDPLNVTMRSDFQLDTFSVNPVATEKSFIRFKFTAGVHPDEAEKAAASPFNLPVRPADPGGPPSFLFTQQDVSRDGKLSGDDHIPESPLIPSLYPLSIFSKLAPTSDLVNQPRPTVVIQGLTLYKGILPTVGLNPKPGGAPVAAVDSEVIVALRPAALCIDAADATKPGLLVVSHATDAQGNKIISDPDVVKAALAKQFGRPIDIAVGCLPEGSYAMNLVYPTGQAWTLPNEAAVCSPLEPMNADKSVCGARARLASQGAKLTIGPPKDASYCASAPGSDAIRKACGAAP